jgi:hypothetical protein
MSARDIPDVRGPAVRLQPQKFLEIDRLALSLQFLGALLGGVHQGLL